MNICKIVKLSGQIMQEHNCLKNNITRQYFWTFLNADFVFGWVTHIRYNLGCCQTDLNLAIIFQSPRSLSFSFYSKPMTTPYKLISPDMFHLSPTMQWLAVSRAEVTAQFYISDLVQISKPECIVRVLCVLP